MRPYLDLVQRILDEGVAKSDRTGVGTLSVFGHQLRFDLAEGFPLVTTKKLHLKSIVHELLWFLRGETNVAGLHEQGVTIWDEWADSAGELGPIYGKQWRSWAGADGRTIDQMAELITELEPGVFVHSLGDAHLYLDHLDQARLQLGREPRPLPTLAIARTPASLFDYRYEDFQLQNYDPHPHIKAKVAV